jgi:4-hydroxythreonine-4-phosphate dehydrogenase
MHTLHAEPPLHIALTTGEPAGVGPELVLHALASVLLPGTVGTIRASGAAIDLPWHDARFTLLGDADLIARRGPCVGVDVPALLAGGRVAIEDIPLAAPCEAGRLDAANGRYVLALLDRAIEGAVGGRFDAIVTAPLQKSTINDAGVPFSGHTEYLAERTHTPQVVMMLAGGGDHPLRVALATTHLPLAAVPAALTIAGLVETLRIIDRDLRERFGLAAPAIFVTGLNPHAGEHGYHGREEIDVIEPAIARAQALGIAARGPYPADTLFQPRYLDQADCVLAMFHDQGLPVLKYATFGEGINVTLGLPIIRTSVDHGTALDLAGSGRADSGSMHAALDCAVRMARQQRLRAAKPAGGHRLGP